MRLQNWNLVQKGSGQGIEGHNHTWHVKVRETREIHVRAGRLKTFDVQELFSDTIALVA